MDDEAVPVWHDKTDEPSSFEASYEFHWRTVVTTWDEITRAAMASVRQSKNPPPCFGLQPDWYLPKARR